MSDWAPVDQAAKDASGNFQVLTGGQWRPAAKVAKNAEGKYIALLDDGAPAAAPATPATPPGVIPETQAPATPRETPGIVERIRGLNLKAVGEAVIDQALGMVGGAMGGLGGLAGGVAGALHQAADRRAQPEGGVERSVVEGAQRGAEAMKQSYYGLPLVGQPSKLGQEYSDTAGEAIQQNAPALMMGPLGVMGQAPSGIGTGLRAATDAAAGSKAAGAVRAATASAKAAIGEEVQMAGDYVAGKVLPRIGDRQMKRVTAAIDNDIPVSPHQLSTNDIVRKLGETAEAFGAGGEAIKRTRKEKLSNALLRQVNPESTGRVLDDATFKVEQDAAGSKIGDIYAEAPDVPRDAFGDLMKTVQDNDPAIRDTIGRFVQQVDEAAEQHGGAIPGSTLREMRTRAAAQARETAAGKGDLSAAWDRVVKRLDDGLEQVIPEDQLPELFDARKSYAISKTLEPLVARYPDGNFPVTALHQVLASTKKGKRRLARGEAGEMGTYDELGRQVLKESVSSGTAERGLIYSALRGELAEKPGAGWSALLWAGGGLYNLMGPRLVKKLVQSQKRREGFGPPKPEGPPPELTWDVGLEGVPQNPSPNARPAPAGPLGDLTPDWETAPGAGERPTVETVPTEGLAPAVDELPPPLRVSPGGYDPRQRSVVGPAGPQQPGPVAEAPRVQSGAAEEIPAVPGRPDLPDTMVAGAPAEVGATEAAGAAMQAPEAALARQKQAEVLQQRAQAVQSPEVKRVLETQAAKLALEAKRMKDAHDLRMEAAVTDDPAIRQALLDHAKRLERAEKVAIGESKEGMPKEKPAKAEKIPAGEATEIVPETVEATGPLPVGEAIEVWGGKRVKDKIPVGEATELPVERVSVGQNRAARYEELKAKLNEHGLSEEEYAEMQRVDPAKATPEEASVRAAAIGVPEEWMQERRHMIREGKSDAEIVAQHDWEKASDRLMAAHDWAMAGRDAESAIREQVSTKMGTAKQRKDPVGFTRKVIDAMNAEAARLEKERETPGTLAHRRAQKKAESQEQEASKAMAKAMVDELRSLAAEAEEMFNRGRLTDAEHADVLARLRRVKTHDDLENMIDHIDDLVGSKTVRSRLSRVDNDTPSANQKFEVGKTYVDASGKKAIYQADGTWKEL